MAKLTDFQAAFCAFMAIGNNGAQAVRDAGSKSKNPNVIASQLLAKPHVAAELERQRGKLAERTEITNERILKEYARIAFANMDDFTRVDGEGNRVLDLSDLSRDDLAALGELHLTEWSSSNGENVTTGIKTRMKLHSKQQALDALAKIQAMFPQNGVLHTVAGSVDVNHHHEMSDEDAARRVAFLFRKELERRKAIPGEVLESEVHD